MTTIDPSNPYAHLNGSSAATAARQESIAERFLTIFVAQMRNQDPLNPLDNAQLTSQLAQISTVNGVERLNRSFETMMQAQAANQFLQSAALVGHEVMIPGDKIALKDNKAHAGFELAQSADVVVTIKDSAGTVVKRIELGTMSAGLQQFDWNGARDSGGTAPEGSYTFTVTATSNGQSVTSEAMMFGKVQSVIPDAQGIMLQLAGMSRVNLRDVRLIN